jgi:hypothetical protein
MLCGVDLIIVFFATTGYLNARLHNSDNIGQPINFNIITRMRFLRRQRERIITSDDFYLTLQLGDCPLYKTSPTGSWVSRASQAGMYRIDRLVPLYPLVVGASCKRLALCCSSSITYTTATRMGFFSPTKRRRSRVCRDEFVLCMYGMIQRTSPTGGSDRPAIFTTGPDGIRISPTELLSICQIWIHFAAASFRRQVTGWSLVLHIVHPPSSVEYARDDSISFYSFKSWIKWFEIQFELEVNPRW